MICAPGAGETGEAVFAIVRSAERGPTVVDAVDELLTGFGSVPTDSLEPAVLLIVPLALPPTFTTSVRFADDAPEARLPIVHVSVCPVTPIVGVVVQFQPPFVSRKKVVCAGTTSVSVTVPALLGPLFVTPIV